MHFSRLPFNWRTPWGYLAAWIIQSVGFLCTLMCIPGFSVMFFGSCWLFASIIKDLANDLPQLNTTKADRRQYELKARFCRTVQYHSNLKQLGGLFFVKFRLKAQILV